MQEINKGGFKPCYKWNTFNTMKELKKQIKIQSFKPYYKWNTFNTAILLKGAVSSFTEF